jgi:glycerol-3-phosphate dehydrogenase subunit B
MNLQGDVLVIGAGLAGLTAAWQVAARGGRVRLIAKGWGALYWHAGCIDVLGYYPPLGEAAVSSPAEAVAALIQERPDHPYARVGVAGLDEALRALQALCAQQGYPLHGSLERNWLLPTAVGALRPTCLAPETMIAGDASQPLPTLIVGMKQLLDFYPTLIADNLSRQGIPAEGVALDLPSLRECNFINAALLAKRLEQPQFRAEVVAALRPYRGRAERIGFPAVLGMEQAVAVKAALEKELGRPVFEIPGLPPSVPGMRLHGILTRVIGEKGGRVYDGMQVVRAEEARGRVTAVYSEAAARTRPHRFNRYLLATGGILGGGTATDSTGRVREVIFDLPLAAPNDRGEWFKRDFLDAAGHPIYQAGVRVDGSWRPVNGDGQPVYENVYAAGAMLAHCEVIRERSLEGVALATGYRVAQMLAG